MMDCIFCRIAGGEIESNILYQDDQVIAFPDINPNAPVHILVVPLKHIESLVDLTASEEPLMGHMRAVANRLARDAGVSQKGYRLVVNCGPEGGQLVPHLHLHLLGGRKMGSLG
ncbi:MAG: histidine triad nucleotide-binding protein [Dehalococcoidia bacterium]|nr:MAG: histidine triad nucleotide-binding protein [Dehalococcoidia bacterium]